MGGVVSRVVKGIKLIAGLTPTGKDPTYAVQISSPGVVSTYFLSAEQVRQLIAQGQLGLVKCGEEVTDEFRS
jgi:hypothetical protein